MTLTTTTVRDIPPIRHEEAMDLAAAEYGRFGALLRSLMDIVYTRDAWMHRIDISRATGRPPLLTAEHDGRLIADMVADWTSTHHQAFSLHLTGPAGGSYANDSNGAVLDVDATDWAWTISGRARGSGLLANPLPL
jgi:hypothetical protein